MRVLVVDDDPELAERVPWVSTSLARDGHRVSLASDLELGRELIRPVRGVGYALA